VTTEQRRISTVLCAESAIRLARRTALPASDFGSAMVGSGLARACFAHANFFLLCDVTYAFSEPGPSAILSHGGQRSRVNSLEQKAWEPERSYARYTHHVSSHVSSQQRPNDLINSCSIRMNGTILTGSFPIHSSRRGFEGIMQGGEK